MKSAIVVLIYMLFALGSLTVLAIEPPPTRPAIQWIVIDFPPFLILSGDDIEADIASAQGPFAGMYRELEKALPSYQHRFVRVSFTRAEKLFSGQKGYCTILLQKTPEREKILYFGDELARAFPVGLVVPASTRGMANDQAEVDLKEILQGKFRLGVIQDRAYAPVVDEVLSSNSQATKIVGDRAMGNLFLMLEKKRLDGVLAYYLEMTEYQRNNEGVPPLKFLKIKNAPDYITVWVSCEKSAWGAKTLQDINKAVRDKKVQGQIFQYFMHALPPQMKKNFQELYGPAK